jgi:Histidine kinase-, DNA gyrase B-, and HSP90-like ATPase
MVQPAQSSSPEDPDRPGKRRSIVRALFGRRRAATRPVVAEPPPRPAPPPPPPPAPEPAALPGLAALARRGQELLDQQLELLGQAGGDQAGPGLAGRLPQIDRLALLARRNAHLLAVLAGGEPDRRWSGPAALVEVVAAAVGDHPEASRVDQLVADDRLLPGAAADDLANLLAELVDNAVAFSAPETRVRISGQRIGSGYVLEVEDRGLGMTDGELGEVNRVLGGGPVGTGQRVGAWVAGRLAERHDVKVQLRRSAAGGVTALVCLPEGLALARPAATPGPGPSRGGRQPATEKGGRLERLPLRRYLTGLPGGTGQPLPKRAPHTSMAPDLAAGAAGDAGPPAAPAARPTARSPEQVRSMLSRYRSGLERGRAAARDLADDPGDDLPS